MDDGSFAMATAQESERWNEHFAACNMKIRSTSLKNRTPPVYHLRATSRHLFRRSIHLPMRYDT